MEQSRIDRINALAKKANSPQGLTPEEERERAALRAEYLAAVRTNIRAQLDNTWIVTPDGKKHKLEKKQK